MKTSWWSAEHHIGWPKSPRTELGLNCWKPTARAPAAGERRDTESKNVAGSPTTAIFRGAVEYTVGRQQ